VQRARLPLYIVGSVAALAVIATVLWLWGEPIWRLLTDEQAIERLVEQAGPWGPLALILISIVQIIVAPIPGYVVQLAAGYLYGPLWGGIFAAIGMVLGGMIAMVLARTFARPLAVWTIGAERLQRWEAVTHSDSPFVWLLLMAAPLGDSVYYLAGLSRVSYLTIFLLTLLLRVPSVFLSTAIGGGAVPLVWMVVVSLFFGGLAIIAWRYRDGIMAWFEQRLLERAGAMEPETPLEELDRSDALPAPYSTTTGEPTKEGPVVEPTYTA
jgi:uncharacterized membrane protein YdjX (TVP38/TMEM64 family)